MNFSFIVEFLNEGRRILYVFLFEVKFESLNFLRFVI